MHNPFRCFNSSPEVIGLAVMMYVRYPLSLRQVEDLLFERGIDVCHETVRCWWNRFGPMFAGEIRRRGVDRRNWSTWRWHLDEVFVRINGETYYLWRAVDHAGEVLEVIATKRRDRGAALKFMKRAMKRYGRPVSIVTDRLRSYRAALKAVGNEVCQETVRWLNNRAENAQWPNSGTSRPCRNSSPYMPRSITTSTTNAISADATFQTSPICRTGRVVSTRGLRAFDRRFYGPDPVSLTMPSQQLLHRIECTARFGVSDRAHRRGQVPGEPAVGTHPHRLARRLRRPRRQLIHSSPPADPGADRRCRALMAARS